MIEKLNNEIKLYNDLLDAYNKLISTDYVTAYELARDSLSLADRWNEIMLNSIKYSKELKYTKSEFTNYCYQKYKILMKIHDICRCIWRQGEENQRFIGVI
jgi:hypothetical protein